MQWDISLPARTYWCGATQKARLEGYGFQFAPANRHGQHALVGPVIWRSAYGAESVSVVVDTPTLDALLTLLDVASPVCVCMEGEGVYGEHAFTMTPVSAQASGQSLLREELGA